MRHASDQGQRGFTLLEIGLTLALIGLLLTLILPRLGLIGSASLQASARQLASRIELLREDAALRGRWVRLSFDPKRGDYAADVLISTTTGRRFVPEDDPLFRTVTLPESVALEVSGPGLGQTAEGRPAAFFAPDGFAEPMVIHLGNRAEQVFSIVVEPARSRPRVYDRYVDVRSLAEP